MKKIVAILFLVTIGLFGQTYNTVKAQCAPGGEWRCYWTAVYASGSCAYYQGKVCYWCDCYPVDPKLNGNLALSTVS